MRRFLVFATAAVVLAGGCGRDETGQAPIDTSQPPQELPRARDGNFVLYVSNQSFETPRVDIRIEIDGRVAVDQHFKVENQHNWIEFRFALRAGEHSLQARSRGGDAQGSWRFTVSGKHWAVVDYWYYPGESKRFTFDLSDEPIAFA